MALDTVPLTAIDGICSVIAAGSRIGPYLMLEQVGEGAYARVFRARHEVMGVERAVKVPRPAAAAWPGQRQRFQQEARLAARLRHPNVVTVYDCGLAPGGAPYLVMELVAGPSLAGRLAAGVMPAGEVVSVAGQVAAALDHAHAHGVIHRDVKPGNVLLGPGGDVCLGDFGIAEPLSEQASAAPGNGLGTPAYMAPEQCADHSRAQGPYTDVYSLAAVVYEMLTGRPPYGERGVACADGALGPPPPSAVNPYLPAGVDRVLAHGLAASSSDRPPSAGALVADLSAALATAEQQWRGWDGQPTDPPPFLVARAALEADPT
jgi:serine/threonine-protein kinase